MLTGETRWVKLGNGLFNLLSFCVFEISILKMSLIYFTKHFFLTTTFLLLPFPDLAIFIVLITI